MSKRIFNSCRRRGGFTIIELMIVISVIGILSGVVVSAVNPASFQSRSRDSRRKADLSEVQGVLEMYYSENLHYPVTGFTPYTQVYLSNLSGVLANYTAVLPSDPSGGNYYYVVNANGTAYELNAVFERGEMDEDSGNDGDHYEIGTDLYLYPYAASTKYACSTSTWTCYQTSSGTYTTIAACESACVAPSVNYSCNTGTGVCYTDAEGTYNDSSVCESACKYSCNTSTGACYFSSLGTYSDKSACDAVCEVPAPENLIANPDFESGKLSWSFNKVEGSGGFFTTTTPAYAGSASAKVVVPSTLTKSQLYQAGIPLTAGKTYRISFAAFSKAGKDFSIRMGQHNPPNNNVGLSQYVTLSTTWELHSFDFTANADAGENMRFAFWLTNTDTYWIDNVSLVELP